jgi:hypothetical protein
MAAKILDVMKVHCLDLVFPLLYMLTLILPRYLIVRSIVILTRLPYARNLDLSQSRTGL